MIGHLGINVPDLAAARDHYRELMPMLGFETYLEAVDQLAYRPARGKPGTHLFLYPSQRAGDHSGEHTGLQHLAFMVATRSDVDRVHRHVVAECLDVVHAPRHFPDYPQPYYATFWLDPFGLRLEAVCHHDRP